MTDRPRFGLYVHWPFCQSKCPYCDFNSHVSSTVDTRAWRDALVSEINRYGEETGHRLLDSIFFGGGTPSLMPPDVVAALIDAARSVWVPSNNLEVTLEANPTSVEAGRFAGYAAAGVNRVSIGIQSLRDADLRALGRLHTVAEARTAIEIAKASFDRVSFDLIYARQNQTLADWELELAEALKLAGEHLSLYQLTIEPGTAFGDRFSRGGLKGLPDEDLAADMFELTQAMTKDAGLPAYEISNHCRPGSEARHNLIYWTAGDWVGVGPGAHGRLTIDQERVAMVAHSAPSQWLKSVSGSGCGEQSRNVITKLEAAEEAVMMGLRLHAGIPRHMLGSVRDFPQKFNRLIDDGLLWADADRIGATARGRAVLNHVLREILA